MHVARTRTARTHTARAHTARAAAHAAVAWPVHVAAPRSRGVASPSPAACHQHRGVAASRRTRARRERRRGSRRGRPRGRHRRRRRPFEAPLLGHCRGSRVQFAQRLVKVARRAQPRVRSARSATDGRRELASAALPAAGAPRERSFSRGPAARHGARLLATRLRGTHSALVEPALFIFRSSLPFHWTGLNNEGISSARDQLWGHKGWAVTACGMRELAPCTSAGVTAVRHIRATSRQSHVSMYTGQIHAPWPVP